MKTATVADLRNQFPKIAAWLAAGEDVRVTRRGKPLARIVPDKPEKPPARPDFAARRKKYWGNHRVITQKEMDAFKDLQYRGTIEDLHGY
jgi:antitoxin (DNA-binding transcriptional repressor) of toxin-antitoxin stability system